MSSEIFNTPVIINGVKTLRSFFHLKLKHFLTGFSGHLTGLKLLPEMNFLFVQVPFVIIKEHLLLPVFWSFSLLWLRQLRAFPNLLVFLTFSNVNY